MRAESHANMLRGVSRLGDTKIVFHTIVFDPQVRPWFSLSLLVLFYDGVFLTQSNETCEKDSADNDEDVVSYIRDRTEYPLPNMGCPKHGKNSDDKSKNTHDVSNLHSDRNIGSMGHLAHFFEKTHLFLYFYFLTFSSWSSDMY